MLEPTCSRREQQPSSADTQRASMALCPCAGCSRAAESTGTLTVPIIIAEAGTSWIYCQNSLASHARQLSVLAPAASLCKLSHRLYCKRRQEQALPCCCAAW